MPLDEIDFSELFHQSSKNLRKGHPPTPPNSDDWPDEWKTTFYKSYPRLPKIALDDDPPRADFFDLIKTRKSQRNFTRSPLSLQELSLILKYSAGNTGPLEGDRKRRAQPSGGARFPIEVYPLVLHGNQEISTGVYHYNVKDHALDVLWKRGFADGEIDEYFTYPWVKNASDVLIMTAVFGRNQNKYGERGYRYILLEAGHIAQNLYLISAALGLKCCALVGTRDQHIEKLLDIDGITESLVYAVAVGK